MISLIVSVPAPTHQRKADILYKGKKEYFDY